MKADAAIERLAKGASRYFDWTEVDKMRSDLGEFLSGIPTLDHAFAQVSAKDNLVQAEFAGIAGGILIDVTFYGGDMFTTTCAVRQITSTTFLRTEVGAELKVYCSADHEASLLTYEASSARDIQALRAYHVAVVSSLARRS